MSHHQGLFGTKIALREKVLTIASGGICLAVAFVLSMIKIFEMPQGGSVTPASLLPIVFFALSFGVGPGFTVAFIFSLLQLINGDLIHPVQILLDYILGFSFLGVTGFFAPSKAVRIKETNILNRLTHVPAYKIFVAVLIGLLGRFVCSVISGVVFFASFAPEGQSPLVHSILYNGSFLLVEFVITVILLVGFLSVFRNIPKKV